MRNWIGVHDPESPGGVQGVPAGLGSLAGLETKGRDCEMIDGSPFNADKAYKDSKVRAFGILVFACFGKGSSLYWLC